jgi:hypothetical protein
LITSIAEEVMRRWMMMAVVACLLLVGCGKPLPYEKAAYAGDWRAHDMVLLITMGGNVEYTRKEGGKRTSINGPIERFEGDSFVVGFGPLKTTFVVSASPHQDQGTWHMTVDGVDLTRDQ